jgi:hypothetical protein
MIQCPACRITYVANTIFCVECGLYLLEKEALGTDPLETVHVRWMGETDHPLVGDVDLPNPEPLTVRLRVGTLRPSLAGSNGKGDQVRELEVTLTKPIRLGRIDPAQDIYPEVDLTTDLALEQGVSREHACIFRRGSGVEVEDLGSTNGTLLNGQRLDPYIPEILKDGDQLQLGKLLIEVSFEAHHPIRKIPADRVVIQAAV